MPSKWTRAASGISHRIPQEYQVVIGATTATEAVDRFVYIATHPVQVTGIKAVWSTASGSGTAVFKKCSSTTVAGGTAMHATAIDTATTAAVVNSVTLTSTTSVLQLAAGDAIGLDWNGTVAALVGASFVISLRKID